MKQVRHQTKTTTLSPLEKIKAENPDLHFVLVEKESKSIPDYLSPIDEMVGGEGYTIFSDDRAVTGNGRRSLLACSKEDFEARQKAAEDEARELQATPQANRPDEFGTVAQGGPMTVKQLEASIGQEQPPSGV